MLVNRGQTSEVQTRIEDIIAEDEKVAVRWTFSGIFRGEPRPGYPQPGERITSGSMSIYRFANGKIEEDWGLDVVSPNADPWG